VRAFKASLMETTARNGDRTLSPTSIPKNLTALRSVLAWAVGQGYVENNPATGITHAGAKRAQWESGRLPYHHQLRFARIRSPDRRVATQDEAVMTLAAITPR
jgi:site-specific recombinase XerC